MSDVITGGYKSRILVKVVQLIQHGPTYSCLVQHGVGAFPSNYYTRAWVCPGQFTNPSQIQHAKTFTLTPGGNVEMAVNPICMYLDGMRKPRSF